MTSRRILLVLVILAALLLAGALVTIQPADQARVVRNGRALSVSMHRLGLRHFGGSSCFIPLKGPLPVFTKTLTVQGVEVVVVFFYQVPAEVPASWPEGDWCSSLQSWVQGRLNIAARGIAPDAMLADPRGAGDRLTDALRQELRGVAIQADSVSARIELPAGWERTRAVPEVARLARAANPVIFVGLDGADWELLDEYLGRGLMPNLARLVREGASGEVTTDHPPLSPIVWTTMMTGASPVEHQILDFVHFNPASGVKEPITSSERRVPAVWNMETMAGKSAAVFGLWATWPAEPVRGLVASDRLFTFLYSESSPPPNTVYPPSREGWARGAVEASEKAVDIGVMRQYLPWLTAGDYDALVHEANPYSKPPSALRRMLVETEIYRRLALDLLSKESPDLTIIYIQGTDTVGHVFAPYAPPKQAEVSDDEFQKYSQVPERYFHHVDDFLGEVTRAADAAHATIVIASDHGFHWKEDRPAKLSSIATATAAKWHRAQGIYLVRGAGIRPTNGHTGRGSVRQICATLLAATGLPKGEHVTGPPLPPLEASGNSVDYRRWYQPYAPPAVTAQNNNDSAEALAKLQALGYIGAGESGAPRPSSEGSSTKTAGAFNNEGLVLKNEGRVDEAVASFNHALALDPKLSSAAWNLSDLLYQRKTDIDRADALLIQAIANGLPEAPGYAIERAMQYQRGGNEGRSLKLLEGAVGARPDDPGLRMFRGRYRVGQNDCAGALDDFLHVQQLQPNNPIAWASAGLAEICLGDRQKAAEFIRRSLELDPNQPKLRQYLGQ